MKGLGVFLQAYAAQTTNSFRRMSHIRRTYIVKHTTPHHTIFSPQDAGALTSEEFDLAKQRLLSAQNDNNNNNNNKAAAEAQASTTTTTTETAATKTPQSSAESADSAANFGRMAGNLRTETETETERRHHKKSPNYQIQPLGNFSIFWTFSR